MQLFRNTYHLGEFSPDITYGDQPRGLIHINQGETRCLETNKRIEISEGQIIWKTWSEERIPFFFDFSDQELFIEKEGQWVIQFDLIASSFFLLSGWQEYFSESRDRYGRFQYSESVQCRFGFTHLPVVNYYFDILCTVVEKAYHLNLTEVLKDSLHPYSVCLTHDIDTCETAWLQGSFFALKKMDLFTPVKLVLKKLFRRDAWFNFSEILSIEKSFGATSTFFFIPTDQKKNGINNADYDLKDAKFKSVFRMIGEHGGEVGLHGSVGSSSVIEVLKGEFHSFPEPIKSNRFHFLLYDPKITPKILEEAGVLIDSSLGFAEHFGFRNSFCLPFQPFDIAENHPFAYYEIPLTFMDGTFQKYLGLSPEQSFAEIVKITKEVKKFRGVLTVLWHNTFFSPYKYPGWKNLYVKILSHCQKEQAYMQSCSRVLNKTMHG